MRLATLASVRRNLRVAIGDDPTSGTGSDTIYNTEIESMQNFFASQFDWEFLKSNWTLDVAVGGAGRYVSCPTVTDAGKSGWINQDRPFSVSARWNEIWVPMVYGIGPDDFNVYDSDSQDVADPIRKWQWFDQDKFEVWPLPTTATRVRFTGQRQVTPLSIAGAFDDDATLDLDDQLIYLTLASEHLTRAGARNAQMIGARAMALFNRMRGAQPTVDQPFRLGGNMQRGGSSYRLVPIATLAGRPALPLTADQV